MAPKKAYPKLDFSRMAPYPLQREIIEHPARFKAVAFGRQSGKSWLAKRVLLEHATNLGHRCYWVAPTIPTAADHWSDLVRLLEDSGIPTKSINKATKTIQFFGGGSIRIRSAEIPDNLRGGTLDFLVIDEAAFVHENVWYKILQPTITASRGEVLFLSTPNGQNWFYTLFLLGKNPKYPEFKSWHMPSTAAPYQDQEMLDVIRQTIPEMVWREEYLAEFLADSGGVFAGLDKVIYRPMLFKPLPGHVYVAGIDWGMDDDYSVFTVADKYERRQVYGERFNSIGTIDTTTRMVELLDIWQPEICNVETNGMGGPLFKLLREQYQAEHGDENEDVSEYITFGGKTKLRGIHINNAKKRQMIESYAAAIEWERFTPLVREDEMDQTSFGAIQMSEMSTFQRKRTVGGLDVTYAAAEGYHDDTVTGGAQMFLGLGDILLKSPDEVQPGKTKAPQQRTEKRSPFQTRQRPKSGGREKSSHWRTRSRA